MVHGLWKLLIPLILSMSAAPAWAAGISLRDDVCTAVTVSGAEPAEVRRAHYACGATAPEAARGWLWLKLDHRRLRSLPPGWRLLVDQTRFARIALIVDTDSGTRRTVLGADDLGDHWAPGGVLQFDVPAPGRDVRGLYLGFERIDDLSLMRKLRAMTPAEQTGDAAGWIALMGIFAGTLMSALVYNIVIHAGRRSSFQRWYLLWAGVALTYGMVWTNMAAFAFPELVGPPAVRINYLLIGLMSATAGMFFLTVMEEGMVPPRLATTIHWLSILGGLSGMAAAADTLLPVMPFDRLLTFVIAASFVALGIGWVIAVARRSRVAWLYLIGWAPVIGIFVTRLLRNLGFVGQNDAVDRATFAALAFEALVFSLVIATRFRRLRQELNLAARRREIERFETAALRRAAETDFLTGLGNRAAYQRSVLSLVERSEAFSLFLIDIDHLKLVNDRLGHAGGDAFIVAVGDTLRSLEADHAGLHLARLGGDEFAVLMPGDAAAEARLLERIDTSQGRTWQFAEARRPLSMSVGVARFPEDAGDADALYHNADLALYSAKEMGRGRHHRYDPLLRILRELQTDFSRDAEGALERGEFGLHFQPIVTLPAGECRGYEALLRWHHPEHGLLLPDRFASLLIADRIGVRIQDHVLDLALRWVARRPDVTMVGINATAQQLGDPDAARHILDRLATHDVSPATLCIEVTEAAMLDRAADTILATLVALHDAGVTIAIDDFGTGLASLVHLRRMPVDRIKIDRSFIGALGDEAGSATAIVRAIIGLGEGLDKLVIAEGIETAAQAQVLAAMGCTLGQGFLFGAPTPEGLPTFAEADAPPPEPPFPAPARAMRIDATP
jgi:diguanylate cyclase (GGDEF)-like protein